LAFDRYRVHLALAAALLAALSLAACGRKSGLDAPASALASGPAASTVVEPSTPGAALFPGAGVASSAKSGFDAHGNPVAPPGEKKGFILDPLLQ
jgi:predicted small lipoprotein YifL